MSKAECRSILKRVSVKLPGWWDATGDSEIEVTHSE
jgi:hypothetical protein